MTRAKTAGFALVAGLAIGYFLGQAAVDRHPATIVVEEVARPTRPSVDDPLTASAAYAKRVTVDRPSQDPVLPERNRLSESLWTDDAGLGGLVRVMEDLDDSGSQTFNHFKYVAPGDTRALVAKHFANVDLKPEELVALDHVDEALYADHGDAIVARHKTIMSMAADAIENGRDARFDTPQTVDGMVKAVRAILDEYSGPVDDRRYMSCGGPVPGSTRVIQFYRDMHPDYFAAEEAVLDVERRRVLAVEEYLQSIGKKVR